MPWRPAFRGERPTLGPAAAQWMIENLAAPDRQLYEPFYPTVEQYEFLLRYFEIDPASGGRIVRRAVLSRARGWGKSPFLAAIACFEGLADAVPDGWDAQGRPVGRPWASFRMPLVAVAAASEEQTNNAWLPLMEMLRGDAPVHYAYRNIEVYGTFINLPYGKISPVTTSVTSQKGFRPVATIMDQTEQWTHSNGGVRFARVLRANAAKVGSTIIESPNAYTPGEGSVAEATATAYRAQQEGRTRRDAGLLWDHREAPPETDLTDYDSLVAGLRYAYGCSSNHPDGCVLHSPACDPGWAPIESFVSATWDADTEEQDARADYLNQITHAADSWLSQPEWQACRDSKVVQPGDQITLGFDGSRGRAKGKPDATALIGCRVSDAHLFQLGVWEAPDMREAWDEWEPPMVEIEDAISSAFKTLDVVGFYCDPARDWRSHVNAWEAKYAAKLRVKASESHPCEWWMGGGRSSKAERAVEDMEAAVRNRDLTHSGDDALTRHVLNARRRIVHGKLTLAKESAGSTKKMDAAIAAVLAYQARLDAVSRGIGARRRHSGRAVFD